MREGEGERMRNMEYEETWITNANGTSDGSIGCGAALISEDTKLVRMDRKARVIYMD